MSEAGSRERDRTSLRRLAEGDAGALDTIWQDHAERAFRHALFVTGRREDAEDVVQTVFVRLAGLGADLLGVRDLPAYLGAMVHREAVDVYAVEAGEARPVRYRADLFEHGPQVPPLGELPGDLGFAGLRVHTALNTPDYADELIAFLGASYFRALGRGMRYGLSARGLAIGTASETGEEFPLFREFYVERPPDRNSVVIHALLDSASVSGVYTFTVRPGDATIVDVTASLYPRRAIAT